MKKLNKIFNTFKEDHLFWLLFLLFIFLWGISTVIFIAFCKVYALPFKDAISPYTNILVFDATIFAPLAAYFFIDNWKKQKQYEIGKQYAENILKTLTNINKNIENSYFSIKNIGESIIFHLENSNKISPQAQSNLKKTINYIKISNLNFENYISIHIDVDIMMQIMKYSEFKKLINKYEQDAINLQLAMDLIKGTIFKSIEIEINNFLNNHKNISSIYYLCNSTMLTKLSIENKNTKHDKTISEYFSDYENTYKELLSTLIRLIKV
ncbi:hypothetical protein [Acinetobacter bereziniae]|uniref:hypothetical protein n=1 Tax=Acinetobacter bereziniae TaxID=106648 RepID=UPI001901FA16|nr:hypothetical protein [Acinetobacter bereziniae]MBJ8445919.1 hypothetical protein [Acinetobacter bereziniae]